MKIGWLYKKDGDDAQWFFSKEEPERWYYCITRIVYAEVEEEQ